MPAPSSTALLRTRRIVEGAVRSFLVVQHGRNPTTSYYLEPRLPASLTRYAELGTSGKGVTARPAEFVIFCRYVNSGWLAWLKQNRRILAGAALFIDDDFDAALQSSAAPLQYRWRVWNWHHRHLRRIVGNIDELWVSTEVLAARYGGDGCVVLAPVPLRDAEPSEAVRSPEPLIVYHATRVHRAELRWLAPVLMRVLKRAPDARLDVWGFRKRDLPLALPRTRLSRQAPWPDYLARSPGILADIGLAPLRPNRLNEARSHVKALDLSRMGAAGIYSDEAPYRSFVQDGIDGLLLPLDAGLWEENIIALLSDVSRRRAIAAAMARKLSIQRRALLSDRGLMNRLLADPLPASQQEVA
jgi:hypothetical protein